MLAPPKQDASVPISIHSDDPLGDPSGSASSQQSTPWVAPLRQGFRRTMPRMDPDVLITLVPVEEAPSVKPVNMDYDTAGMGGGGLGFGFGFGGGTSDAGAGAGRGGQQGKAPNSPGESKSCLSYAQGSS